MTVGDYKQQSGSLDKASVAEDGRRLDGQMRSITFVDKWAAACTGSG